MGAKICCMVTSREDDRSISQGTADPLLPEGRCAHLEAFHDSVKRRSVGVDAQSFSEDFCPVCSVCGQSQKLVIDHLGGKERESNSSEPSTDALPCQGASEPAMVEERHSLVVPTQSIQTALTGQQTASMSSTRVQPAYAPDDAILHLPRDTAPTVGHGSAVNWARFDSRRYRLAIPYRFAGEYRSQIVPPPNRTVFDAPDCMCDFSVVDHTAVPKNSSLCFLTKSACQKKLSGVKKYANRSCNGHTSTGESATKAAKVSSCSPDSPVLLSQSGLGHSMRADSRTSHDHNNTVKTSSSQSSTQRLLKRWPLNLGGKSDASAKR
uniref:Uncharacterized protein n=1 Tax=Trichuris muris TaxID=70415 RepID=A0A5S6Q9R8_TRIMR